MPHAPVSASSVPPSCSDANEQNIDRLASRVRAEFLEMPGLSLTERQAQRLWGLPPDVCCQVIERLVAQAILKRRGKTYSLAD